MSTRTRRMQSGAYGLRSQSIPIAAHLPRRPRLRRRDRVSLIVGRSDVFKGDGALNLLAGEDGLVVPLYENTDVSITHVARPRHLAGVVAVGLDLLRRSEGLAAVKRASDGEVSAQK